MRSSLAAFVAAFWLAALVLSEVDAESFGRYGVAFAPRSRNLVQHSNLLINVRGGATLEDDEDEDDEIDLDSDEEEESEEEEDDEEDEEELAAALAAKAAFKAKTKKSAAAKEPLTASTVKKSSKSKKSAAKEGLAASTVKASTKSKTQKAAAAKEAVNVNLMSTSATSHTKTKKKKKSSILKMLHVPYIIGACLNPITLFKMTKGFWVSLFDLDYLKQVRMKKLSRRSKQPLGIESLVQQHNHCTNVLN
jgi:hypothetical protein